MATLLLGFASIAPAQTTTTPEGKTIVPPAGTEAFRSFLATWKVTPVKELKKLRETPSRSLLIVLGGPGDVRDGSKDTWSSNTLQHFASEGGAILFATDRASAGVWRNAFGIEIKEGVFFASEARDRYRPDLDDPVLSACPIVVPRKDSLTADLLFADLSFPVVTNRPGVIDETYVTTPESLAGYGASFSQFTKTGDIHLRGAFAGAFARGGTWNDDSTWEWKNGDLVRRRIPGPGKVLFLADHSVFTNALMVPTDNGNFDFAYNALNWLTTDNEGKRIRDRCLFLEEGKVVGRFDVLDGRPEVGIPSPEELLDMGNALLQDAQQDNLFNKLIADGNSAFFSALPLPRLIALLAGILAIALVVVGLMRFLGSRSPPPVTAPSNAGAWYRTVPLLEQRQHALIQSGNLFILTQDRIRAGLLELGAPANVDRPTIVVAGGWWARRTWTRLVERLGRVAWSDQPQAVTVRKARDLSMDLAKLRRAVKAGIVRWETA